MIEDTGIDLFGVAPYSVGLANFRKLNHWDIDS